MYKQGIYTVTNNEPLTADVFSMTLSGDTGFITAPGQFINIKIDGLFLRRPISVCDFSEGEIEIIYKVVGAGTRAMSRMKKDTRLDVLTGLGNGFSIEAKLCAPVLIGGGVGAPPLYALAKSLILHGHRPRVVLGFNKRSEVFLADRFQALELPVTVCTADGSLGVGGFVTDGLKGLSGEMDYYYACGPLPMLRAVYDALEADGQLSFEERMGCGFGACMGCTCKTKYGAKRLCVEGPVLRKEEVVW